MTIFLGSLGLLQNVLLPGLLVNKLFSFKSLSIIQRLLTAFVISLIVNYLLVFSLAAMHIYTRAVLFALILAEIAALIYLYRNSLTQPLRVTEGKIAAGLADTLTPIKTLTFKSPTEWMWIISGCAALSGVLWSFHLVRLNIGTVFNGWDTLYSWNTYAEIWALNEVPQVGGMYPQLIPANWSISYVLTGENKMQMFNTILPPLFFVMIQTMLFDLGYDKGTSRPKPENIGFFSAAVICRFAMKKLMGDHLFDGYMDVPAAAICLLSFYVVLKAKDQDIEHKKNAVLHGVIFASSAAITKQSGFIALITIPFTIHFLIPGVWKEMSTKEKRAAILTPFVIVFPWYLLCIYLNTFGPERELVAQGILDYNHTFDTRYRLRLALSTLGKYKYCFIFAFISLLFVKKHYRVPLALYTLPLTVIWAVTYSYDARNIASVLPFVSLLCGFGISSGISIFAKLTKGIVNVPTAVCLFAAIFCAAVAVVFLLRDDRLVEINNEQRKALFGAQLNQDLLYSVIGEEDHNFDIYTDYPAQFLYGYEDCCIAARLTDPDDVSKAISAESNINWLLLPVVLPNNTDAAKEILNQSYADNIFREVKCSDGYYKSYCLYERAQNGLE